jgi:peptidoglycan hydrolase-like protein with peptidoglycan-binding domain
MRRSLIAAGVATIAVGAAAAGVVVGSGNDPSTAADGDTPAVDAADLNVAPVSRRDLVRNEELDGTVGFGTSTPLVLPLTGTLTSVPKAGQEITNGSVIAEVDGQPVIALVGSIPMWRDLGPGIDDGDDVLQLETILAAMGFTEEYDVTVDTDWTDATTNAVEAFQEAHGQEDDGTITRGEIVFIESPVRVETVGGALGQATTEAAIEVTDVDQVVRVNLELADAALLDEGTTVTVELPDGTEVPGTVSTIGDATTSADGGTSLPVDIVVDGGVDVPNGTPVDVLVAIVSAENVLAVPVEAVLALAEGGYAVEVRDGATTHLVGVELGTFADGMVEITGDVAEGAEVVVP